MSILYKTRRWARSGGLGFLWRGGERVAAAAEGIVCTREFFARGGDPLLLSRSSSCELRPSVGESVREAKPEWVKSAVFSSSRVVCTRLFEKNSPEWAGAASRSPPETLPEMRDVVIDDASRSPLEIAVEI